jgi:hypothetical protein
MNSSNTTISIFLKKNIGNPTTDFQPNANQNSNIKKTVRNTGRNALPTKKNNQPQHQIITYSFLYIKIPIKPIKNLFTTKPHFHHMCTCPNIYTLFDQNRSNIHENRLTALIILFNHNYYLYHTILTIINMFTVLTRFIIHLFIIITSLLYIYSLLFIFLLLYIITYFLLFLEEKNKISKILGTLHFDLENPLFKKPVRRH